MRQLLEFNDQVCVDVTGGLVALLLEDQLSALGVAWLHFNLLYFSLSLSSFGIELNDISLVGSLLDRATVEFFESAIECDNDIGRLPWLRCIQTAKTVSKDALLHITTGNVAILQEEVSILELLLEVALSVHSHEVSSSDSFAFWSNAALLESVFTIDVVDRLIFDYKKLETVKMCAIKRMKLVRLTIGENIVSFTNLTEPQLISGHIGRITEWVIS